MITFYNIKLMEWLWAWSW